MKYLKGTLATSHVDAHNERMVHEALVSMVDQINSQYIPVGIEHDPRIPPQGRIKEASLIELEDGEFGVEGIIEVFEEGENVEQIDDGREIPIRGIADNQIHLIYDRSYRNQEDEQAIEEIKTLIKGHTSEEAKKAVEPISILIIALSAAAGSFFAGLLEKAGADAWDLFKDKVKKLVQRKKEKQDCILSLQFTITDLGHDAVVEALLSNPNNDEIEEFFVSGIKSLDKLVPSLFPEDIDIRKIVVEYSNGKLKVLYGIRKDCVPLWFTSDDTP